MNLSVAIVCKNSERTIARTLESVAGLADEIVAVDSGSTDRTIAILEQHDARVLRSEWLGFGPTKQIANDACQGDWVLALDSDESVLPELAESVREAISSESGRMGYDLNRKVYYRGQPLNHIWQPERIVRLTRRDAFRWGGLEPHAYLQPVGPEALIGHLRGDLRHDSIEDGFVGFLAKQVGYAETMAASMHASGKRSSASKLITRPAAAMLKQLILKRGYRDGRAGWLAAASMAAATLMKYTVLLELDEKRTKDPER
ncbi:MAG: glycosyltransferase family 2 protein [Planctomycetota bacterium]